VTDESHNRGPSEAKGKGTDPLNWGYVDIDPAELDTEVQKREFEHIEAQKIFASKERVAPIAAKSPEKDPKEVAQESNRLVTEKSHKKMLRTEKTGSKKDRKKSRSRKSTPNSVSWNVLAATSAERLEKLGRKAKGGKKRHRADALWPVD
jgi:hypothetical protein